MRFSKEVMTISEAKIRNFIKTESRLPAYVMMQEMDTDNIIKVEKPEYCGLYFSNYTFWHNNKRFPNYVTLNLLKDSPNILNFQDNKYNCGPASLEMISTKLFKPILEEDLAKIFHTDTSGTSPEKMTTYDEAAGFIIERIPRSPAAVQSGLNQYRGVLCHYETGDPDADCAGFKNNYGHWAEIVDYVNGKYKIYDPTRGIFWCNANSMDHAVNNRTMYYYTVRLR